MMNDIRIGKQIALLLALICVLITVSPALAEEGLALTSVPEPGASVQQGDTITFTFHVQDVTSAASWGAIQVITAEGLEFQPDTISCSIASAANSVYDVVPGNDGFLLLPDGLTPGDSISFEAMVVKDATTPKCMLQTDAFTLEAAYTVSVPRQTAPAQATPALSMQNGTEKSTTVSGWLIAGGALLIVLIALAVVYRTKLKRWFRRIWQRLLKKNQPPVHDRNTEKDQSK